MIFTIGSATAVIDLTGGKIKASTCIALAVEAFGLVFMMVK